MKNQSRAVNALVQQLFFSLAVGGVVALLLLLLSHTAYSSVVNGICVGLVLFAIVGRGALSAVLGRDTALVVLIANVILFVGSEWLYGTTGIYSYLIALFLVAIGLITNVKRLIKREAEGSLFD